MKKYIYLLLSAIIVSLATSCSKDAPFEGDADTAYGQLLTASLDVSLKSEYGPRSLRDRRVRAAAPSVNDFTVEFYRQDAAEGDAPVASYKYSEMPEIITLPVGSYTAKAFYGSNPVAAWDEPYYEGSTEFSIEADKITENVEPIVCTFANVRVSVNFDDLLLASMSPDCKVTVKVGDVGELDFTLADMGVRSGYFRYVEGSTTLVATFTGTVDYVYTVESKSGIDVKPGTHYQINFRLHDAGEDDPGFIVPGHGNDSFLFVDAEVKSENMDADVDSGETGGVTDDLRPTETPDDPGKDEPGPDDPSVEGAPEITVAAPYSLDRTNEIELDDNQQSKYPVVLYIKSTAPDGLTGFKVNIISNTLTPSVLVGAGLTDELDLINPGEFLVPLQDLGFLKPGVTSLKGEKDVELSITDFLPLLTILGEGTHQFRLTVTDANGTTVKTLTLHNN